MKANHKHYTLLFVGLLTLIVTGIGYWYVYKVVITQAEKQSEISQEIINNEQNNKQEIKMLDISSSTLEKRDMLSSYFVSEDKILDFIKSIENVADDSSTKITLSSINTDKMIADKKEIAGHIKVHAEIKGSWTNVNKALVLIENLPYFLSIESMRLDVSNQVSEDLDKKISTKTKEWNLSIDISALTIK